MAQIAEVARRTFEQMRGIPHSYTRKELRERDDKYWLEIHLSGRTIWLPMVDVGEPKQESLGIAYFQPHPDVNPVLCEAGAQALAKQIERLKPRVLIALPSHKSGPMVNRANELLRHQVPLIELFGSDSREEVEEFTGRKANEYIPITRVSTGIPKFLGATKEQVRFVQRMTPNGVNAIIVDDFHTTGESANAAAGNLGIEHHTIVVVGKESLLKKDGSRPTYAANIVPVLVMPEIPGLWRSKLIPFDPEHIPPAIVVK